jgi:hypothetical protein
MAGAPHGKLRRCEKLAVLRKLLALLIHFHIVGVRDAAREIETDLAFSTLAEATLDKSVKSLGSQCMQAAPGAKGEILDLLKGQLRKKPARHHPVSLSWVKAAFPDNKQNFYRPCIFEIARIRTFINCTGLPAEAQFVVVLESAKKNALEGKDRNWYQTSEVDPLFTKFETGKLKSHLVFVEKKPKYYDLLVIVCPPCVQPVALTCAEEEWRAMFTEMVEKEFGSKSHREVDKGFRTNNIYMSGFRWTRNFDYCYRDTCAGPFTLSAAAAADVYGHADFETSMEKFVTRMGLLLQALSPAYVAGHKQHTGE